MSERRDEEMFKGVVSIIARHAKSRGALEDVRMDTEILRDLQVNSTRLVDILLEFEEMFDLEIPDDQLDQINTVGDAYRLVHTLASLR